MQILHSIKEIPEKPLSELINEAKVSNPTIVEKLQEIKKERAAFPFLAILDDLATIDGWEKQINILANDECKKLGIKLRFQIYLIPSQANEFKVQAGHTVIIHYYGLSSFILQKSFWSTLRRLLVTVKNNKMERTASIVRKNYWYEMKVNNTPELFKLKDSEGAYQVFDILDKDLVDITETITVTAKHKLTGIVVKVSGLTENRTFLENHAKYLLSKKVAELKLKEQQILDECVK